MNAEINNCQIGNIILLIVFIQVRSVQVIMSNEQGVPTLDLPAQAYWVPGRKSGTMVLLNPHRVKLRLKSKDAKFSYYWCSRTEEDRCPVRVTQDRARDLIVSYKGTHNHDSGLVKEAVMAKYRGHR